MQPTRTIKIVIADDFEIFRCGYKQIIETPDNPLFEIIAEASNGIELVEKVRKLRPDIVITDIKLSMTAGTQACRTIQEKYPKIKIIVLSSLEHENLLMEMIAAGGANGYLIKQANKNEVLNALKAVCEDLPYYCGTTTKKLFEILKTNDHREKKVRFSIQEMKVIQLICKQLTTKEIAHTLRLGNRVVEEYRHNILEKIGAKNAVGIGMYAVINGLVTLTEL